MAVKAPGKIPMIPAQYVAYTQPTKAAPWIPGGVDARQHSFATAGRSLGFTVGLYIEDGSTVSFLAPVPPGIGFASVSFWMSGVGSVSIDSPNNSVAKTWSIEGQPSTSSVAVLLKTTSFPGTPGTKSSPLQVRTSMAWTWTAETVTVTFTSASTGEGGLIHTMCFEPIWLPANT